MIVANASNAASPQECGVEQHTRLIAIAIALHPFAPGFAGYAPPKNSAVIASTAWLPR
ncbi:hypothetical protein [Nocardia sp. NPDC005998]|uniref:hypothetical protein n=1 Tax=Nocardia sp. NPDC005998 TaxID=3156894 RepID=UPI0033B59182